MRVSIVPEPTEAEREAILAALALAAADDGPVGAWAEAALAEGVEENEREP